MILKYRSAAYSAPHIIKALSLVNQFKPIALAVFVQSSLISTQCSKSVLSVRPAFGK